MLRLFIKVLIIISVSDYVVGQQRICGNELIFGDKSSKEKMVLSDGLLKKHNDNNFVDSRSEVIIPVVVHVLWFDPSENVSDAAINGQLDILNQAFSGINRDITKVPEEFRSVTGSTSISFFLASITPYNEYITGIARKRTTIPELGLSVYLSDSHADGSEAGDSDKYLNN